MLRRAGLNRLDRLHRVRREIVPYEHPAPGDLLHLDVKRLGRIPDGGRQRVHGRASTTPRVRGAGHDFLHVASTTTAAFLERALTALSRRGADVRAVLTDNARAYDSRAFRAVADAHAVSLERTQPYRPQTNGKAERFIRCRGRPRSVPVR